MPTGNIKYDYNLQPYGNNGDTTGRRDLAYYHRNLTGPIKAALSMDNHEYKSLLDLGCGNGRINTITKDLFETILCVDPIDELHDKFKFDNVSYAKKHIDELIEKYDVVLMVGSMHSIWRTHGEKTKELLERLVNKEGYLMEVSDIKHEVDVSGKWLKLVHEYMFDDNMTKLKIYKNECISY